MADFAKISKKLKRVLGKSRVLFQPEEKLAYSFDAGSRRSIPSIVLFPETAREVIEIVETASEFHLPIVPRGAGTGMTGGSIPINDAVALSFERMNRILKIDASNRIAIVEPGVVTVSLQDEAIKFNLYYPPDPASFKMSTIGGNVAENSGGLRCLKYGVTADYLIGTEFITMTGEVIKTGYFDDYRAPYDLTQLLCGSEGTLGIIVKIALRLIDKPHDFLTLSAEFPNPVSAAGSVTDILNSGFTPSVLEFMDKTAIEAVSRQERFDLNEETAALLIIEFDDDAEKNNFYAETTISICRKNGALSVKSAKDAEARENLWKFRRSTSSALTRLNTCKINEDIAVPRSKIAEIVEFVENMAEEIDILIPIFGHAGDGNIHINFIFDKNDTGQSERAEAGVDRLFTKVVELGGSISGEHGIGLAKQKYLPKQLEAGNVAMQKQLKAVFDPQNLLNPGKIFV